MREVREEHKVLYRMAKEVLDRAYCPYSGFHVAAALRGKSGRVYTGVNVENASYGCTLCAERTACVKAVSEGEKEFDLLAVCSSRGEASMCGICRQFLSEFCPEVEVVTGNDEEHLEVTDLGKMLPDHFVL